MTSIVTELLEKLLDLEKMCESCGKTGASGQSGNATVEYVISWTLFVIKHLNNINCKSFLLDKVGNIIIGRIY